MRNEAITCLTFHLEYGKQVIKSYGFYTPRWWSAFNSSRVAHCDTSTLFVWVCVLLPVGGMVTYT
jgi:hypothetical protein